ncbi:MAG: polysaccharide deacetylase family protein, partial [Pseudomonadales bacterium]
RQVAALANQGRAASLEDIEAFVRGERALPRNACLITIDDGMLSTYEHAVPILVRHRVPAAIYVSSNLIGRRIEGAEEPYVSWDQLREIAGMPGITIGSHAHTHRSLGALSVYGARCEAAMSKQVLEDQLGIAVRSFAYPFGTTGDFDPDTDALLRDVGYTLAFNSIHGAIRAGMEPVSLPRVKVEGGESHSMFELVSRGATLPWQLVDRHLWRLQRLRQERV